MGLSVLIALVRIVGGRTTLDEVVRPMLRPRRCRDWLFLPVRERVRRARFADMPERREERSLSPLDVSLSREVLLSLR
jgi:hypothetical protein